LAHLDDKCRQIGPHPEKIFGGIPLIFIGDPDQSGPHGDKLIITSLINYAINGEKGSKLTEVELRGVKIFMNLEKYDLSEQVRSLDVRHNNIIEKLRRKDNPNDPIVDEEIIGYFKQHQLTAKDYLQDNKWLEAISLVTNNLEREIINIIALKRYAKYHNRVIYRWRKKLAGKDSARPNDELEDVYNSNEQLRQYFCYGCPIILLNNLNPGKGFANGSMGTLHSLYFKKVISDLYLNYYL